MGIPLYNIIAFRYHRDPDPIKFRKVNSRERLRKYLEPKGIWYVNFYGPLTKWNHKAPPYSDREYYPNNSPYNRK